MKLFTLILMTGMVNAIAGTPTPVAVPVNDIYVPNGFDSNDTTEVVVSGFLPNLCHKSPTTEVTVTGTKIDIKVTALKYDESNPFCPEMIVPFLESVKVGLLNKGNYKITVNGKTPLKKTSKISIAESTSSAIDNHVYARVDYIEKFEGSRTVSLRGYNPSDCMVLDKVKFISNKSNTYSVLPIMKQIRDFCPMKMQSFAYEIEVPSKLKAEKVLLHVRGMDGNSVNTLFSNL